MSNLLRAYIKEVLQHLTRQDEISTLAGGAIVGVTTPLGTGPTYPDRPKKKKRKKSKNSVTSSFGGGTYHKDEP